MMRNGFKAERESKTRDRERQRSGLRNGQCIARSDWLEVNFVHNLQSIKPLYFSSSRPHVHTYKSHCVVNRSVFDHRCEKKN